jgi:hypothetical protein
VVQLRHRRHVRGRHDALPMPLAKSGSAAQLTGKMKARGIRKPAGAGPRGRRGETESPAPGMTLPLSRARLAGRWWRGGGGDRRPSPITEPSGRLPVAGRGGAAGAAACGGGGGGAKLKIRLARMLCASGSLARRRCRQAVTKIDVALRQTVWAAMLPSLDRVADVVAKAGAISQAKLSS